MTTNETVNLQPLTNLTNLTNSTSITPYPVTTVISHEMIIAAATADAQYSGRNFDSLGNAEKRRYKERAYKIIEAALHKIQAPIL